MVTECAMVMVESTVVEFPYDESVPYSTCESAFSSVSQVIVTLVAPIGAVVRMFVMTGAVPSAGTSSVVKVAKDGLAVTVLPERSATVPATEMW